MPDCTGQKMRFGRVGRRAVEADFTGGALGSDGGVMLVRETDRKIGLSRAVAAALLDPRDPERIKQRLRQAWPGVRIIVRGDSGFCRQRLIRWCERYDVGCVIGVARNARLHKRVETWETELEAVFAATGVKQRAILRNIRRVRIMLASHHPLRETFLSGARALAP